MNACGAAAQRLQASSVDTASNSQRAYESFVFSLLQSLVVVDTAKVFLIVGTSPRLLARAFPPRDSCRNRLMLKACRRLHNLIEASTE